MTFRGVCRVIGLVVVLAIAYCLLGIVGTITWGPEP